MADNSIIYEIRFLLSLQDIYALRVISRWVSPFEFLGDISNYFPALNRANF